jgi:hypothetical protein
MGLSHTTTRCSQLEVCCNSVIAVLLTSIGYFTRSAFLLTWNVLEWYLMAKKVGLFTRANKERQSSSTGSLHVRTEQVCFSFSSLLFGFDLKGCTRPNT